VASFRRTRRPDDADAWRRRDWNGQHLAAKRGVVCDRTRIFLASVVAGIANAAMLAEAGSVTISTPTELTASDAALHAGDERDGRRTVAARSTRPLPTARWLHINFTACSSPTVHPSCA